MPVDAVATKPAGEILKLKPARIALYDQYGGLAPSGWTRWLLEQFEFPFEVVCIRRRSTPGISIVNMTWWCSPTARIRKARGRRIATGAVHHSR